VRWHVPRPSAGRALAVAAIAGLAAFVLGLAVIGEGISGGGSMLFAAGQDCNGSQSNPVQPAVSDTGRNSIPANYLQLYQQAGQAYQMPWTLLAGIGKVESDHGRANLPGVRSGQNGFGAAGPMQIGIGGASTNTWGGAPVHPASEHVSGVATDGDHDGVANVYDPADAVDGAAKYLLAHGVLSDVSAAIFAYNHLLSYVQEVLFWAGVYAKGGYTVTAATQAEQAKAQCKTSLASDTVPNQAVSSVIAYARAQIGKPYVWGGTGPDGYDCSGLVMMAYRSAGIDIPRTSEEQWPWGPRVPPGHEQPGDLVFFPGADGTVTSPGHVGLVIGRGLMIEAYATGFPIRIAPYRNRAPVGFTRPWAHSGVHSRLSS
jgi:cell wall-associated NlpC family hydrolase